jgi:hypothetical protein
MRSKHQQSSTSAAIPVVLFGIDGNGKPKAACFSEKHASLAAKAAEQLQLRVLPVVGDAVAALAARLPVGRIHARGRGFVPFIKRDLYVKLIEAAGPAVDGNGGQNGEPVAASAAGSKTSAERPKRGDGRLPPSWDDIAIGDVVVAHESLEDGWYEAVVVDRQADMLMLRWHDWPRDRRFSRHRLSVALLYPALLEPTTAGGEPKERNAGKRANSTAPSKAAALPRNWDEIDAGALVLAQEDGPMRSWWEAIPVEKADEAFTIRWRDYARVANVVRHRHALALLHPNGKTS